MKDESVYSLINELGKGNCRIECAGLTGSDQAYLVSKINKELKTPALVVVDNLINGERFVEDLRFFTKNNNSDILWLPDYNILSVKAISYHNETTTIRIRTLFQLTLNEAAPIIVTTVPAMMKRLVPKQELINYSEIIITGEDIDLDDLIDKMISGGYERTGIVEEPGDFCIHGGIIDIFSPFYKDPLRIELFGDAVDSINFFSALTQRKIKLINEAVILPSREVVIKKDSLTQILARIREQAAILEIPITKTREIIEQILKEKTLPELKTLFL